MEGPLAKRPIPSPAFWGALPMVHSLPEQPPETHRLPAPHQPHAGLVSHPSPAPSEPGAVRRANSSSEGEEDRGDPRAKEGERSLPWSQR